MVDEKFKLDPDVLDTDPLESEGLNPDPAILSLSYYLIKSSAHTHSHNTHKTKLQ